MAVPVKKTLHVLHFGADYKMKGRASAQACWNRALICNSHNTYIVSNVRRTSLRKCPLLPEKSASSRSGASEIAKKGDHDNEGQYIPITGLAAELYSWAYISQS